MLDALFYYLSLCCFEAGVSLNLELSLWGSGWQQKAPEPPLPLPHCRVGVAGMKVMWVLGAELRFSWMQSELC